MRKIIPVVAAGATAMALAGGSFGYAAATKDVTLSVDGSTTQVSSRADTVAEVLQARGVSVGQHDVVAPAPNAQVADGTRIAVKYGRPVTVHVDGHPRTGWTTATRVDQALASLNVDAAGAALSTSGSTAIPRRGLAVQVATLKTVTLDVAGHQRQVKTTGRTVADAVRAAHLTLDADDRLSARSTAPLTDGAALTYTKVDARTLTKKQQVAYHTVHHRTGELHKGVTRVQTSGRPGVRTLTYRETRHNGQVASRRQVHSEVTTKPRTRVVLVGTKVIVHQPATKHAPASKADASRHAAHTPTVRKQAEHKQSVHRQAVRKQPVRHPVAHHSSPKGSSSSPRVASGGVWDKIARCESGGNWHINTGNGFYGGLQFTLSTWRAYGGSGMPNHASRGRQIAVAKRIQASQGWGAWPACTSKLGLR